MNDDSVFLPGLEDIRRAADRIREHVHRTPVMRSATLDGIAGASLHFKCENFQKVGAFKARGATNAVLCLSEDEAARGVATHSSGNHAAALARAAGIRGVPAYIVMPSTAPRVKRAAVASYGATISECEPTLAAREATLEEVVERTGAAFVHPYDNPRVIAGQGTAALELMEEIGELDVVMAPVGGGGLLSGTAIAVCEAFPGVRIFGAEPAQADDAYRSLQCGKRLPQDNPATIADGLRTALSERTFAAIRDRVEDILTVQEESILRAMRLLWERMKIVVEPSAAVPLAAVLEHPTLFARLQVGLILSGGNVDLDHLPWVG